MRTVARLASSLLAAFALVATAGCGGDSILGPSKSAIAFKIDAATCAGLGSVTLNYFIDGTQVGNGSLSPGQQSDAFKVDAGSHVTLALIANSQYGWNNTTLSVGSGQTMVRILTC